MKKFKIIMLVVVVVVLSINLKVFAGTWEVSPDGIAIGKDIIIEYVRIDEDIYPSVRLDTWPAGINEKLCFGADPRLVSLGTKDVSDSERVKELLATALMARALNHKVNILFHTTDPGKCNVARIWY